jgi:endonuclease/exonuclease/phosphatase family metal-dependent hydrolase
MNVDVAALQEVDVRTRRTGYVDEPQALASALSFSYVFAASIKYDEGDYGLAVLSRWPIVAARRFRLDVTEGEPRIVLEVVICANGRPLHLFDHHADTHAQPRDSELLAVTNIVRPYIGRGVLVVGDFNEQADGPGVTSLEQAGLVDLGVGIEDETNIRGRIDFALADHPLARLASNPRIWPTAKSDHNAMLVDLRW